MIYIALLRAINVGGHRKIKMADLRDLFSSMGFKDITTYIQSGNVIFSSDISETEHLSRSIEMQIKEIFGYDVVVIIRMPRHLKALFENNPFEGSTIAPFKLYVTFFQHSLSPEIQNTIRNLSNEFELYEFHEGELFSLIDKKTDQKVLFSNNYVEKIAGVTGTTRNWKTVNRILELAMKNE